ncbi:MAG: tRNA (guanosine(37)-N1)-methyltransferase TrmD [Peptoniphilus sp.]|uniref:tRNA (guanosine(37)-N1)-methyltransferase TrmD n=1 Tax=Peptoniphilus sp. TaxID=1971214 RepID=UPI002A74C5CC|nr:tRNA (guanosine(37)-N1)-methyltransferase TrmD [Peptoniphilus sp.]MDY2986148.1 tRNA (guanosine(37)-N1)-methyltransferase TrmD [Peptoniphilus sp.]
MKFSILTLFPEFFEILEDYSIISRAIKEKQIDLKTINIRDFSENKHHKVDDYPSGGGPGMLMQVPPIKKAIDSVKTFNSKVIYLSAQGSVLNQKKLVELSKEEHLILLNGHYEGIDNRVIENYVDEEISLGDYVLTGGEMASMVLVDGITRLLPGVLSSSESYSDESHYRGILEYPQYTRPQNFEGFEVPEVLLSGNHKLIEDYRRREALKNTLLKRPDLLKEEILTSEELDILNDLKKDI